MRAALALLVGLQVADLLTTYAILSAGGVETNPLGSWALGAGFAGLVALKAALTAVAVSGGLALEKLRPVLAFRAATVVALFYAGVVGWNLTQIGAI